MTTQRWPREVARAVLVALAFGGVFGLRVALEGSTDPVGEMYVIPVIMAALWFGLRGGLASAAFAFALVVMWDAFLSGHLDAAGYVMRVSTLLPVGLALGAYTDRLARATSRADALMDTAPDALVQVDSSGKVVGVNTSAVELFGYAPSEIVGQPVDILVPEPLRRAHSAEMRRYWTDPQLRRMAPDRVLAARLATGEILPVEISLAPVVTGRGVGVLATVRDVSERHRADELLRQSEARFRCSLETMLDPFEILTAVRDETGAVVDFTYDYVNAAAAQALKLPVSALVGRRYREGRQRRGPGSLFEALARTVETGQPLVLYHASDEALPQRGRSYYDVHATAVGDVLSWTWRDVTGEVRRQVELTEAAHRFTAAFDRAPTGAALVGLDLVIKRVNRALEEMLKVPSRDLVGRPLSSLIRPRESRDEPMNLNDLIDGTIDEYRTTASIFDGEGADLSLSISAARVTDASAGNYLIVHVEDVTERARNESRLAHMASHDALTDLLNRSQFMTELEHHLAELSRYDGTGALILLDLDHFKYANDTLGHATGDALIRAAAGALASRVRESDVLARLGGDEFAVLAPVADEFQARTLAEALLEAVREDTTMATVAGRTRTTASAGLVLLEPGSGSVEEVLAHADLAMYAAKEEGRDRYVVFDPGAPYLARWQARYRWMDRVKDALENELFELEAQPILQLSSGRVTQYELLLRMRSDHELVLPSRFLEIAERHGMARAIDRWVVEASIRLAAAYSDPSPGRFEVNLSAESLTDPELPELIRNSLELYAVDPDRIIFELTETAALANLGAAREFVERITALGCRFALDDFGAGFGSFYNLKHLPLQYLKIDGEFVRQLPVNRSDQLIVQAIVGAAHGLGKQTIAEYVTDDETLELLRSYGVDFAQGYHVGRPAPPARAFRGRAA